MRILLSIVAVLAVIVLLSECDNLTVFIVSKVIAIALLWIVCKLMGCTMTDDELNERV